MRKIREVLRLRLEAGLSFRQICSSTKLSIGYIQKLLKIAELRQLPWPLPEGIDDSQLTRLLYPTAVPDPLSRYQLPDWASLHQELKHKGMTKQLLWEEYAQQYPERAYSYSQFCERYRLWRQQLLGHAFV